jgi:hypothetical protein
MPTTSTTQAAVDAARAIAADMGDFGTAATRGAVERLLERSHRLAYSTFAPLQGMDMVLDGICLPPFPSILHMQLSTLNQYNACASFLDSARRHARQSRAVS